MGPKGPEEDCVARRFPRRPHGPVPLPTRLMGPKNNRVPFLEFSGRREVTLGSDRRCSGPAKRRFRIESGDQLAGGARSRRKGPGGTRQMREGSR